jgi:hypothetical protein
LPLIPPRRLHNQIPALLHIGLRGLYLPCDQAQGVFAVELGLREEDFAGVVQGLEQALVEGVELGFVVHAGRAVAEADQVKRHGGQDLEIRLLPDGVRQPLPDADVLADAGLQAFHPVSADHKPELERTEAAPELYAPVAVIVDLLVQRRFQVFRQDAEGLLEQVFVLDIKRLYSRSW